jgi:hypothetical protein
MTGIWGPLEQPCIWGPLDQPCIWGPLEQPCINTKMGFQTSEYGKTVDLKTPRHGTTGVNPNYPTAADPVGHECSTAVFIS